MTVEGIFSNDLYIYCIKQWNGGRAVVVIRMRKKLIPQCRFYCWKGPGIQTICCLNKSWTAGWTVFGGSGGQVARRTMTRSWGGGKEGFYNIELQQRRWPKRNLFTIPELRALLILSPLTKLEWEPTVL